MFKRIALIVLLSATAAIAQEKGPTIYKVEYTVIETEGAKKLTSRSYTLVAEDHKRAVMRVGTRVPVRTTESQYTYMDVGVNLDSTPSAIDASNVRLDTTINITSIATVDNSSSRPPVTRNCQDSVTTVVPLDKVVTLATQDDPSNNTTLQVQVIVKLVK